MRFFFCFFFIILFSFPLLKAQENKNISWIFSYSKNNDKNQINIHADIKDDWYLYGENIEDGGPLPLLIEIENAENVENQELISMAKADLKYDSTFEMNVETYTKTIDFQLNYNTKSEKNDFIIVVIDGQICNSKDGKCEAIYEKYKVETK